MTRLLALMFLSLLAAACATPYVQEAGIPTQPARLADDAFFTADGTRLPLRVWPAEAPKAVLIGLHGMNDYAKAFAMPGPWWAEHGIATYAYDQRGFGRSPGAGLWPGDQTLVDDARSFVALIKARHPGVPVYLIGVSMGGAVALSLMAEAEPPAIDGLILVAPAVWGWSTLNPFYKASLWLAAHTFPAKTFTGASLKIMPSDNIDMLRDNFHDPYIIKKTRTDAIYGLVGLMNRAHRAADRVHISTLVLYGARDEIIPRKPVEDVIQRLGGPTRVAVYKNGYHMLLRDLQAENVWADIAAWIEEPHTPLPSGEERMAEKRMVKRE